MGTDPLGQECRGVFGDGQTQCTDYLPEIEGGRFRRQRIELLRQARDQSLSREQRNSAVWQANLQILPWLAEEAVTFGYNALLHGLASEIDESEAIHQRLDELLAGGGDYLLAVQQLEGEGYDTGLLVQGGMPGGPARGFAARVGTGRTAGGMQRATLGWRARYGPAALRDHHLVPQELLKDKRFVERLQRLGVEDAQSFIDRKIARIPQAKHAEVHESGWNAAWKKWLDENPDFTVDQIEQQVNFMMKKFNVPRASRNFVRPYGENSGGQR